MTQLQRKETMGHLDKLKISNRVLTSARPRHRTDTVEHRRRKLIANVEEQIELAVLALEGEPLELLRKRGHRVVKVRPRLWWKEAPDGVVQSKVRYNKEALTLARSGSTIEVPSLRKLPAAYRAVIRAVKAGELDQAIEGAVRKARR
jgi:hypothetical protein